MSWLVLRLAKRPEGADLPQFQQECLRRAAAATQPAGCVRSVHSQAVARAYRQDEPPFDCADEYAFDDLGCARAWRDLLAASAVQGENVLLTRIVPIVAGQAPPGALKHIELVHRRMDLDRGAFLSYWREVHGPLAATIPHLLRYLQCPSDEPQSGGLPRALDGVAMLWFASVESMRQGVRDPSFERTREDMARFMDLSGSGSVLTQEAWSS